MTVVESGRRGRRARGDGRGCSLDANIQFRMLDFMYSDQYIIEDNNG